MTINHAISGGLQHNIPVQECETHTATLDCICFPMCDEELPWVVQHNAVDEFFLATGDVIVNVQSIAVRDRRLHRNQ